MAIATSDAYMWCITYRDGTDVKEFDGPESIGRGFAEVDHAKVYGLHLLPVHAGSMRSHGIVIPEDATPIFFRRRTLTLDMNEEKAKARSQQLARGKIFVFTLDTIEDKETKTGATVHCIGWKRGEQSVYLFIWEDGSSLLTEDLQAV